MSERQYFPRILPVRLSSSEIQDMAQEQSTNIREVIRLKNEKKLFDQRIKTKTDELENQIKDSALVIKTGTVDRNVDCFYDYDFEAGVKRVIRADTMAEVGKEGLSDEDRQRNLSL